jgi:uncharacterized protein (TIGR02452 family)
MEYDIKGDSRRFNKFEKSKPFQKPRRNHNLDQKMIDVYQDTLKQCKFYKNTPIGQLIDIYDVAKPISIIGDSGVMEPATKSELQGAIIEVENIDTFDMAIQYDNEGLDVMVLNMASDYKPGGGVGSGKTAQEEVLFRRSNAVLTHPSKFYPLEYNQIIYSECVNIFKSSTYQYIDDVEISMISVPAIRKPKLYKMLYKNEDYKLMYDKIEAIFRVGIQNKHTALVLGALGCGVFNNPPDQVAEIFKIMIDKYKNYFKKIGFAVLVVKDSDNENLESFIKKIL